MDNQLKDQVRELILEDSEIVALLGANHDPYNKTGAPSHEHSVIDYINASPEVVAPFITIRAGESVFAGPTTLTNAFILLRCYNEKDKTFYTINEVMSRVRKLLNGHIFTLEGYANVETVWETTSAELPDEGLDLRYREIQFRVQLT